MVISLKVVLEVLDILITILRRIVQRIRDFLIPRVLCEVLIFQSTAKTGPFGYPW